MIKDIGNKKWYAVIAIALAAIAFGLDLTVLNLALPTLAKSLNASNSELQWIVAAYSLALSIMIMPAGLLGDRYGRKKWLIIALVIFGISSLACAYSGSALKLIIARVALGAGGAFILPLAMSTLAVLFNDEERSKALAIMIGANFAAFPLGPILGGWLLTHYWWGSVFLINVPIVIIAIVAIAILLPETKNPHPSRIDYEGILFSSAGLAAITYGAIDAGNLGWGSLEVLGYLLLGVVLVVLFVLWERHLMNSHRQPLVDLRLFESAGFTWGTILTTLITFCMFGLLFTIPQYFQSVESKSVLQSGVHLLPMIVGLIIAGGIGARFGKKLKAPGIVALGFLVLAAGLFMGSKTTLTSSNLFSLIWVAIVGLGLGLVMPTSVNAALGALQPERSGVGASLNQSVRQVGSTLGVAVLGSIIGASYRSRLNVSYLPKVTQALIKSSVTTGVVVAHKLNDNILFEQVRQAFIHGMGVMLIVCAILAIIGTVLALKFLPAKSLAKNRSPDNLM